MSTWRLEKLQLFILFLLGLVPLLWWRPGFIIAKGDYFPLWSNPQKTLGVDVCLWFPHYLGNPNTMSSYMLHEYMWLLLTSLIPNVGFIQILLQVFFFFGSGFSMYYLSKTVYPRLRLAPLVSGIFYMFNFFVLESRLNLGFSWTYTLLPLLMALLIRTLTITNQQNHTKSNKHIIYFSIALAVTFPLVCTNPANVVIISLILTILALYYLITQRNQMRPLLWNMARAVLLFVPLNIWWMIPILNYYALSSTQLSPQINVVAWSWTQQRSSFLNLFWLNGEWGWRPEYFPYYDVYTNPALVVLTFVPFLVAAVALLFRSEKSRFNAYIMFSALLLIFLAKGLHEPMSQLNMLFYKLIPGMTIFREPTSKFTMALMPFLALLVGYSVNRIADKGFCRIKHTNLARLVITVFFIVLFIGASYPLLTDPIESRTQQIPYSSRVRIPEYWYQATEWLNGQHDEYKVLVTPLDDYYQIPYTWGYFGTDQYLERLIQKPIVSTYYTLPYAMNPDVTLTLQFLYDVVRSNRTVEFQALLNLLSIKYILQRNDVVCNFTNRNILSPSEMQEFLSHQPYIQLTQKFGQLDIYEYTQPKPYIYALEPAVFSQTAIKIENKTTVERIWNFASPTDVQEWLDATQPNQWKINYTLKEDGQTLKAELWNSTWGWKTINSPFLPAKGGSTVEISLNVKGKDAHSVHVKMIEFDKNKKVLTGKYIAFVGDGNFNWTHIEFNYEPTKLATEYVQIQVWHGHETDKPFPNIVWVDNVHARSLMTVLNTTGLDTIFPNALQTQPAAILNYTKTNPTEIVAKVNATEPFVLAISEALDNSWTAYVNGKPYKPLPLYLGLKGFSIDQIGLLEIIIEYEPQRWFFYGSIISVTTFLVCLIYITCDYSRGKGFWRHVKHAFTSDKRQQEVK
jgi:hypothetical protein